MSRVRTLETLHLTAFDPQSIIVNNSCLEEVNRLRSTFRKDLLLYELPEKKKRPVKRNLLDEDAPAYKTETEPRLREDVMFQSLPPQPKSVKLQMTIKTVKLWGFIDLQHHNMNGQTTGTSQWMKHGNNKHANCWGYGSYDHFNDKKEDQT